MSEHPILFAYLGAISLEARLVALDYLDGSRISKRHIEEYKLDLTGYHTDNVTAGKDGINFLEDVTSAQLLEI